MVVLVLVVVLVAGVLARALRRQHRCAWYDWQAERACVALRHRRFAHRHVWTTDEHLARYDDPWIA